MNIENLLNFKKYNEDFDVKIHKNSYFLRTDNIYTMNSDAHKNCGIYCKGISNKKLLIAVGESWTYGDSLEPYVKAIDKKDCLAYRVSTIFSGKLANYLNSDLLVYAEPGFANIYYWTKLETILDFIINEKYYDELYLVIQMTSPGRDYCENYVYPKIEHLFSIKPNNFPILSLDEWVYEYDKTYFNWLKEIINKYSIKSTVLWKNFNDFYYKDRNFPFKVIEIPFHKYAVEMSGFSFIPSKILETVFYDNINKFYNLKIDLNILENELDKIKNSFELLNNSMLNNWHPNDSGHWILATLMREKIESL